MRIQNTRGRCEKEREDRQSDKQRKKSTEGQIGRQRGKLTDRKIDRRKNKYIQTHKLTNRQTGKHEK